VNDQQLIDYVRATEKVRVVQVADKFDMELEDARGRLEALVETGDLKISKGFSPAGIACLVYDVAPAKNRHDGPKVVSVASEGEKLRLAAPEQQAQAAKSKFSWPSTTSPTTAKLRQRICVLQWVLRRIRALQATSRARSVMAASCGMGMCTDSVAASLSANFDE